MNVVLTGATGYLGSRLLRSLLAKKYSITILIRSDSNLTSIEDLLSCINIVNINKESLNVLFAKGKIDLIIHAATCYGRKQESVMQIIQANIVFPLELLQLACEFGVPRFVNIDTCLEKFMNMYSLSKKQLLEWGKYIAAEGKLSFDNLELQNFFGPLDSVSKFVTFIIDKLHKNEDIDLTEGTQKRDFLYITDMIEAIMFVIQSPPSINTFRNFELGSGRAISIKDLVNKISSFIPSNSTIKFGKIPTRTYELALCQADTTEIKKLGWKQKNSLNDGLMETIRIEKERF